MVRAWVTLSVSSLLLGCTVATKGAMSSADLARFKRTGVVVDLGTTFYGVSYGATPLQHKSFAAAVPDWNVERHATDAVLRLLRSNANIEVAAMAQSGLTPDAVLFTGGSPVWAEAQKQGFDRLVLIRQGRSDNNVRLPAGYGLYELAFFGSAKRCLYVAHIVEVYDVSAKKLVAWDWGGGAPCRVGTDDTIAFRPTFAAYSDGEKALIRETLESRVVESIRHGLQAVALLPVNR
jgi:hypothetical protein